MEGQDLKLFAKCYISFSENTTEDKKKLFRFVEQASEGQVWYLLTHGQMAKESYLNEIDWASSAKTLKSIPFPGENFFQDFSFNRAMASKGFSSAGLDAADRAYTLLKGGVILSSAVVAAIILWMAVKAAKGDFTRYKQCMKLPAESKKECKEAVRKMIWQKELKTMLAYKKLCSRSKDPDKCNRKIDKKINKLKQKLSK